MIVGIDTIDAIDDLSNSEFTAKTKEKLVSEIFDYVYCKFKIQEFELFKTYVSLKPTINYADLSNMTSLSQSRISEIISKIKRDVVGKFSAVR